jgi:ubiquinone/menaquinone biosynthesis C-methylase UbiE
MSVQVLTRLSPYLDQEAGVKPDLKTEILSASIPHLTHSMRANSYYFGHPEWGRSYLNACHQYEAFKSRWLAATGSWQDKIVVDIGCGPGNLYAALRAQCGVPQQLIGVDISAGALKMAKEVGYTPILADAQNLPFVSGFADIVTLNATVHHCDDMTKVLQEAARLVRPGGLLVTDHDPQTTAWGDNLMGRLLWNARLPLYRLLKRGGHRTAEEQFWSTATEAHHSPGDGVTIDLYRQTLEPMGLNVQIYPHNRSVGAELFQGGDRGRQPWNLRLVQRLSGVDSDAAEGAMILMCIAKRL